MDKTNIYGSASFLSGFELMRLLSTYNKGLVIDGKRKISEENSYKHCAVIAPTGTGKTTRFIIPNVLNAENQSIVITDPSGEIYSICAGYLGAMGYKIKILNAIDLSWTHYYNPLVRCTSFTEIQKMASILIDANLKSDHTDPFWNDSAKAILSVFIRYIKQQPIKEQTLSRIYRLLNEFSSDRKGVNDQMARFLDQDSFLEYSAFLAQEDKLVSNIISTAKTALSKMSDPALGELTREDTLDFEKLREEKTALFVIVPEDQVIHYSFLLTLFYSQLFSFCMQLPQKGKSYLPIWLLLDEFGNLGELPGFSTIMTTLRKRHCSVSIVLQDVEQLKQVYGDSGASTILNGGCASKIYYPGLSLPICEELERTLGKKTVLHKKEEFGEIKLDSWPDASNAQEIGRSLMTADEIRTMKDNQALFIHANKRPVKLTTLPWYQSRKLVKRSKI